MAASRSANLVEVSSEIVGDDMEEESADEGRLVVEAGNRFRSVVAAQGAQVSPVASRVNQEPHAAYQSVRHESLSDSPAALVQEPSAVQPHNLPHSPAAPSFSSGDVPVAAPCGDGPGPDHSELPIGN